MPKGSLSNLLVAVVIPEQEANPFYCFPGRLALL